MSPGAGVDGVSQASLLMMHAWLERAAEETYRAQAYEGQMYALLGRPQPNGKVLHLSNEPAVNWNSPDQVMDVFRARGHTLDNTNSQSLTALLGNRSARGGVARVSGSEKRAGTYGKSWLTKHLHPVTGRIHARLLPAWVRPRDG